MEARVNSSKLTSRVSRIPIVSMSCPDSSRAPIAPMTNMLAARPAAPPAAWNCCAAYTAIVVINR